LRINLNPRIGKCLLWSKYIEGKEAPGHLNTFLLMIGCAPFFLVFAVYCFITKDRSTTDAVQFDTPLVDQFLEKVVEFPAEKVS
jgi:hypothetical protein